MKKIFVILITAAMFVFVACEDFLNIQPVSVVGEGTLLTESGFEGVVTGMYNTLYTESMNGGGLSSYVHGNVLGADANKGSTATDQPPLLEIEQFTFSATNSYVAGPWNTAYNGVFRSNMVLDMAEKLAGTVDDAILKERATEARFIRAMWYFNLIQHYGAAVPWVDLEGYRSSTNPQISNVDANGDYIYIWENVIDEFEYCYQNLPATQADLGRPNKWAALAFKTKVMMFRASPYNGTNDAGHTEYWPTIKTNLETLMSQGVTSSGERYGLDDEYGLVFRVSNDNSKEKVFEIQQAVSGTSGVGNTSMSAFSGRFASPIGFTGGWDFMKPSQDLAQSYVVDANGLPYIDHGYQVITSMTQLGSGDTIEVNRELYTDPRIDYNLGRYWIPLYDWDVPTRYASYARAIGHGGNYIQKKNLPTKAESSSGYGLGLAYPATTTRNIALIRYAEILLWYAEALIETGDFSGATAYVNMVRERASNGYVHAAKMNTESGYDALLTGTMSETTSPYTLEFVNAEGVKTTKGMNAAANYRIGTWPTFTSAEQATKALRAEYRAELAFEGRRWFDLNRWGVAADELNNYVGYEKNFLSKFANSIYNAKYICLPIPFAQINTMEGLLVQSENWK